MTLLEVIQVNIQDDNEGSDETLMVSEDTDCLFGNHLLTGVDIIAYPRGEDRC